MIFDELTMDERVRKEGGVDREIAVVKMAVETEIRGKFATCDALSRSCSIFSILQSHKVRMKSQFSSSITVSIDWWDTAY